MLVKEYSLLLATLLSVLAWTIVSSAREQLTCLQSLHVHDSMESKLNSDTRTATRLFQLIVSLQYVI
jgi:hypothetical protein